MRVHKAAALSALLAGSVSFRQCAGHYPNSESLLIPQLTPKALFDEVLRQQRCLPHYILQSGLRKAEGKRQRARDRRNKRASEKRRWAISGTRPEDVCEENEAMRYSQL